jgi:SAM-dependent methyltransferase
MKKESVNSFYNSIAHAYENQLTDLDQMAREEIARLFNRYVHKGIILDFGGGTGLDLPWLLISQHRIIFAEPSFAMRAAAKKKFGQNSRIVFLEEELDFTRWSEEHLPFVEKVDSVLANFAVLNCIENMDCLFEKIALIGKKYCHLIITIIDPRFMPIMRNYSILSALRLIYFGKLIILNNNNGIYHETHLHTIAAIKKASHTFFEFESVQAIEFSNFVTICLRKK